MRLVLALALLWPQEPVEKLILKLGDDDVDVREQASRELVKIGKPALGALRKAMKSEKAEIAGRAKALVEEIDFPEPGTPDHGIALAIRAQKSYDAKEKIVLQGRLHNTSDADIEIRGLRCEGEGGPWGLSLGGEDVYHLCFRPLEPGPDLGDKIKVPKGKYLEFTFSPRAWCAMIEHSKCGPMQIGAGSYRMKLVLGLPKSETWSGSATSNEVDFVVK